jgi:hypothetical protein
MAAALHYLNSPPVKNTIKNVISAVSATGGVVALCQIAGAKKGKSIEAWWRNADKTTLFLQTTVVLNGIASRPGLSICEWLVHRAATPATLEKIFGQNTIFERNPTHPRHLFNVAVNALATAALIKILFAQKRVQASPLIKGLIVWNFITGRSTLHLANDLWYAFCKRKRG